MSENPEYRRRILTKANDRFFNLGFARVTMDDLAAELGMSKKTLYKYFPSKIELLKAVVQEFMQYVITEQDRILNDPKLDYEARLSAFMKLLADVLSRINQALIRDVQRVAPEVWDMIETVRQQRIDTLFGGLLREGQKRGFVRQDFNLPFVIFFIAVTIRETLNPEVVSRYPISLMDAFDTLRSIIMGGILSDSGRDKFLAATRFQDPDAYAPAKQIGVQP